MKKFFPILILLGFVLLISNCKKEDSSPKVFDGSLGHVLFDLDDLEDFYEDGYNIITGDVQLDSIDGMVDMRFLSNVTTINGHFQLSFNSDLETLEGLENLRSIPGMHIKNNDKLSTLKGFDKLEPINYLYVEQNKSLQNFLGLPKIDSLSSLYIIGNDNLIDLNGLLTIVKITRDLRIEENENLTSLGGLNSLVSINDFSLINNKNLLFLSALSSLVKIEQHFRLLGNNSLINLSGLNNLKSIGGNFLIGYHDSNGNQNLSSLDGLENLIWVDADLEIRNNSNLTDYCAIQDLMKGGGVGSLVRISNNLFNPTPVEIASGDCSQ